jgi:diguanylate cyclase (GGDEF)-like protein/PAS domain S-box-containing protein
MVEQISDVFLFFEAGSVTYISPSASAVYGWNVDDFIGTDGLGAIVHEDFGPIKHKTDRIHSGEISSSTEQCRVICGDGTIRWCEAAVRGEVNEEGLSRCVVTLRDISERKQREDDLTALALQDGLTGLANRRAFDQALDREWARTLRSGGEMALLLIDADCFKQFNDTYGHQAGDDCLRAIAGCVRAHTRRPSDVACRYGGEELVVILGESHLNTAVAMGEAIRSSVAALNIPHEQSLCDNRVTVSVGVAAALAREGGSIRMPEGLLQAADHALYKAKAAGRNRVVHSLLIAPDQSHRLPRAGWPWAARAPLPPRVVSPALVSVRSAPAHQWDRQLPPRTSWPGDLGLYQRRRGPRRHGHRGQRRGRSTLPFGFRH